MKGISLELKRDATLIEWTIKRGLPPKKVRIPLSLTGEKTSRSVVCNGQRVEIGQKIAEADGEGSVAVHASLAGRVSAIGLFPHAEFGRVPAVEIEAEGDSLPGFAAVQTRVRWEDLDSGALADISHNSGFIKMGTPVRPLADKVRDDAAGKIQTVLINACESEPYITSGHSLILTHPMEILKGTEILRRGTGARKAVIVCLNHQLDAAEILRSKIFFLKWKHLEIKVLPSLYPQGHPALLLSRYSKPGLPEIIAGFQCESSVYHLATCYAVYEAVVHQKPFYERAVTVGGECVFEPRNIWARIGTSAEDLIKSCKGLLREPEKVLFGGPMTGIEIGDRSMPLTPGTQGLLALPKEVTEEKKEEPCIRCGECVDSCPSGISPVMITLAAEQKLFSVAREYGAEQCIGCGNCQFVCPSKRPMMDLINEVLLNFQGSFRKPGDRYNFTVKKRAPEAVIL